MDQVDAWLNNEEDGGEPAKANYKYMMRPEPMHDMGPIVTELDPLTGLELRHRMIDVGMVRNAAVKARSKVFLDPIPHIRMPKAKDLQGWYSSKDHAGNDLDVRPRPCFTDAILTQPYGGTCQVGCSFCYINSGVRGYRGAGLVTVPVGYGEHVRNQLMTMRTSAAGYFSSFTDPFLPLEDLYHNTQAGAEEFVRQGLPVFFLSRLSYPSWAKDILTVNRHSYAQKSINTPDEDVWRKLSPGAISLREHLEEIREMRSRNIYVSIQCNPIIPGLVNHNDVERLFEKLAAAGANHVIVKFVEAGYSWASTMVERHVKRFGAERMEPFVRLFTQNIGGQKTVDEAYRLEGHERYRRRATELGLTYSTCYEYKYLRDEAGDPVNKRGVSIGADFITSAQCHGHRVPMYTRTSSAEQFAEVKECPPTGCLLCADNNAGKPRCGSELFGSAKALRLADLRKGVR